MSVDNPKTPPATLEAALEVLNRIGRVVASNEAWLEDETVDEIEKILRQEGILP